MMSSLISQEVNYGAINPCVLPNTQCDEYSHNAAVSSHGTVISPSAFFLSNTCRVSLSVYLSTVIGLHDAMHATAVSRLPSAVSL